MQAVAKLKLSNPPPAGVDSYQYLQEMWKQEQLSWIKISSRWFSNEYVAQIFKVMQKMIAFYHNKNIHMVKLGCTLTNLVGICLYQSTDAKLNPFAEGDKNMLKRVKEHVLGGLCSNVRQLLSKLFFPEIN